MPQLDPDKLMLIVVGADLRSEVNDRPHAYGVQELVQEWLHRTLQSTDWPILPVVCTDIWYLNNEDLHDRPAIAIGGPGVNAFSAYLHQKLATALAVQDQLVIQMDVELIDLRVSIWGMDAGQTASAVDLFEKKYLGEYMRAVLNQVHPEV